MKEPAACIRQSLDGSGMLTVGEWNTLLSLSTLQLHAKILLP